MTIEPVGVIGLGVMGSAMAGQLLNAGFAVQGYDVDRGKCATFAATGGQAAGSVTDVAASAQIILLSLATVPALVAVTEELGRAMHPGQLCVEMGTFGVDDKQADAPAPRCRGRRADGRAGFRHRAAGGPA